MLGGVIQGFRLPGMFEGFVRVPAQGDYLPPGSEAFEFLVATPSHDENSITCRFEKIFPVCPDGPRQFPVVPDDAVVTTSCNEVNHKVLVEVG